MRGGYIGALPPVYSNSSNVRILVTGKNDGFTIFLRNVNNTGIYPLNFDTAPWPDELYPLSYVSFEVDNNNGFYTTTSTVTGSVEITRADTINRIVSGRFSFNAIDRTTGKKVKVTDGRFDCKTGL